MASVVSSIVKVIKSVKKVVNEVKANNQRCSRLEKRLSYLTKPLKKLKKPEGVKKTLKSLLKVVKRAQDIVQRHTDRKWWEQAKDFRKVRKEFDSINEDLKEHTELLQLDLSVEVFLLSRQEDDDDERVDSQAILARLDQLGEQIKEVKKEGVTKKDVEDIANAIRGDHSSDMGLVLRSTAEFDVSTDVYKDGGFSTVYVRVTWRRTMCGSTRKLKVVLKVPRSVDFDAIMHETGMLSSFSHENIVKCFGITSVDRRPALILEYCDHGDLRTLLAEGGRPSTCIQYRILRGTAAGMAFLHSLIPRIVHGDLKSPNVLLSGNSLRPKIADFGSARWVEQTIKTLDAGSLSVRWAAPERLTAGKGANPAGDVYAWGVIAWEVLSGKLPHSKCKADYQIIQKMLNGDGLEIKPSWVRSRLPDDLEKVAGKCLSFKAKQRPGFSKVIGIFEESSLSDDSSEDLISSSEDVSASSSTQESTSSKDTSKERGSTSDGTANNTQTEEGSESNSDEDGDGGEEEQQDEGGDEDEVSVGSAELDDLERRLKALRENDDDDAPPAYVDLVTTPVDEEANWQEAAAKSPPKKKKKKKKNEGPLRARVEPARVQVDEIRNGRAAKKKKKKSQEAPVISVEKRRELLEEALLAEELERYDEMAEAMDELVIGAGYSITEQERNLFSVAHRNLVGARRAALLAHNHSQKKQKTSRIATKIKKELVSECEGVIEIVIMLIGQASPGEDGCFYWKMMGDYMRYLAEIEEDPDLIENAKSAYEYAEMEGLALPPTNPVFLGLQLNRSVFLYEIVKDRPAAMECAKQTFDKAITGLDSLSEDSYKDSTLIMQLLRDNLTLWASVDSGEGDTHLEEVD